MIDQSKNLCECDGNNLPHDRLQLVVRELQRRGGRLASTDARLVEGEDPNLICRCQVLGGKIRIYQANNDRDIAIVLFGR
jgi:hypothetical protein